MNPYLISRREALRQILLLTGVAMAGSDAILRGASLAETKPAAHFSAEDVELLDEIGETILPATNIPGAKAVQIGAFMAMMVTDCYTADEQAEFLGGMAAVNDVTRAKFGKSFLDCTPEQRTEIATELDREAKAVAEKKSSGKALHYFKMFKDLTLVGYFSSEIGCTQAVRYIEVPGYYKGDLPYKKGDPAWATF